MLVLVLPLAALCGCNSLRLTEPPRTASEQFLMSQAVARAVEQLSLPALRDKMAFVDSTYLPAAEREFLLGELRAKLLTSGVRLAGRREDAKIIVEVRSGGVGVDRYGYLVGIPAIHGIDTPELPIVRRLRQQGYASVALVAYWADTGELVTSAGPVVGRTFRQDYWILFTGPRTVGDITPTERPR